VTLIILRIVDLSPQSPADCLRYQGYCYSSAPSRVSRNLKSCAGSSVLARRIPTSCFSPVFPVSSCIALSRLVARRLLRGYPPFLFLAKAAVRFLMVPFPRISPEASWVKRLTQGYAFPLRPFFLPFRLLPQNITLIHSFPERPPKVPLFIDSSPCQFPSISPQVYPHSLSSPL